MVEMMIVKRMVGRISGTVIFQNWRQVEAPSRDADSYRSLGMACMAPR
jgi:hypothetical protein